MLPNCTNGTHIKTKISIGTLQRLIILFFVFEPRLLTTNTKFHVIATLIRMILLLGMLAAQMKCKCSPKVVLACVPYYVVLFYSCSINGTSFVDQIPDMLVIFCVISFSSLQLFRDARRYIYELYILSWCLLIINAGYMFFNPWDDSFLAYGFLGGKNDFGPIAICIVLIASINYLLVDKARQKRNCIALVTLTGIECFWLGSTTGVIGYLLCICLMILVMRFSIKGNIFMPALFIYLGLFLSVVVFQVQNYFASTIYNITGKEVSFTGRSAIWKRALEKIKNQFWLGYGKSEVITTQHERTGEISIWAAHNGIMDLIIVGGILLLMAYCFYCFVCVAHAEKNRSLVSQMCVVAWFAYSVMLLVEYYEMSRYYILIMVLLYYSNYIMDKVNSGGKLAHGADCIYTDV